MTSSASYQQGDIVLVTVAYADQPQRTKLRPVVIVSAEEYNAIGPDLLVASITSNPHPVPHVGDHRIEYWQQAGLALPSIAQAKITTTTAQRIRRKLGVLHPNDLQHLAVGLQRAFGFP